MNTILRLCVEREALRIVDDQQGLPTWERRLAQMSVFIFSRMAFNSAVFTDYHSIYHVTTQGITNGCGSTRAIINLFPDKAITNTLVEPINTKDYPLPTTRPAWSVLDTSKVSYAFWIYPTPWDELLQYCLNNTQSTQ